MRLVLTTSLVSSAKFFSSGCAPGANASSPFCNECAGSGKGVGDIYKCKASAEEKYYGYAGAFRYEYAVRSCPTVNKPITWLSLRAHFNVWTHKMLSESCSVLLLGVLLRMLVMLPSSNTQLLQKTVMVRNYLFSSDL